jgi:hypothetical protein
MKLKPDHFVHGTLPRTRLFLRRLFSVYQFIPHCGIEFRILTARVILKHVPCQQKRLIELCSSVGDRS